MRKGFGVAALILGIIGLVAWRSVASWESEAVRDVSGRVRRAGIVMANAPRDSSAADVARRVVGTRELARIDTLQADGHKSHGTVVLRIEVTVRRRGFASGGSHDVRCFRYDFPFARQHDLATCPSQSALVLPSPTPAATLPIDSEARLRAVLAAVAGRPPPDADSVRAKLRAAFTDPRVNVDAAVVHGFVGLAVDDGDGGSMFARSRGAVGADAEVWRVPRVLAQPGELGCLANFAASGAGKRPPH